ncbi:MAG: lysophospholipid acyltransferase family protein [Spirochaetaceae bacterium]
MGGVVFFVVLLSLLTFWDANMKVRLLFRHDWAAQWVDERIAAMSRQLFVLARFFTGFGVDFSSDIADVREKQYLVVCNHQSLADIPIIRAALPELKLRFVAKRELKWGFPGVSTALRVGRHALVHRKSNMHQGMAELRRLGRMARRRQISPVVFPEGTRSRNGEVRQFRGGAIRVLNNECPMPIMVIAVDGGYKFGKLRHIIEHLRGAVYRIKIVGVLPAAHDRDELAEALKTAEKMVRNQIRIWRTREEHGTVITPTSLQLPRR